MNPCPAQQNKCGCRNVTKSRVGSSHSSNRCLGPMRAHPTMCISAGSIDSCLVAESVCVCLCLAAVYSEILGPVGWSPTYSRYMIHVTMSATSPVWLVIAVGQVERLSLFLSNSLHLPHGSHLRQTCSG